MLLKIFSGRESSTPTLRNIRGRQTVLSKDKMQPPARKVKTRHLTLHLDSYKNWLQGINMKGLQVGRELETKREETLGLVS